MQEDVSESNALLEVQTEPIGVSSSLCKYLNFLQYHLSCILVAKRVKRYSFNRAKIISSPRTPMMRAQLLISVMRMALVSISRWDEHFYKNILLPSGARNNESVRGAALEEYICDARCAIATSNVCHRRASAPRELGDGAKSLQQRDVLRDYVMFSLYKRACCTELYYSLHYRCTVIYLCD